MGKRLSNFANYCQGRNINVLFTGNDDGDLYFTVNWPGGLSDRVHGGFEKRILEDNLGCEVHILYKELRCTDREVILWREQ